MHQSGQPQDHAKLLDMLNKYRDMDVLPLLELVAEQTPDGLEAFCNQVIFTVSELLRDDQPGGVLPGQVMQILQQLHTLREAIRQVRGAPSWP